MDCVVTYTRCSGLSSPSRFLVEARPKRPEISPLNRLRYFRGVTGRGDTNSRESLQKRLRERATICSKGRNIMQQPHMNIRDPPPPTEQEHLARVVRRRSSDEYVMLATIKYV